MALFGRRSKRPVAPSPASRGPVRVPATGQSAAQPGASAGAGGPARLAALEPRIREIGEDMLARARSHKSGLLSAKFYSDKLMNWSMQDQNFKVQLFRFVDAFPMLRSSEEIYDHLTDYLFQPGVKLPPGMETTLRAGGLAKGLTASTMAAQIKSMAGKFIAGTDAASALDNLRSLWKDGIAFSVDLLGEACVSDAEADAYQAKYLDLINNLPGSVASWAPNPRLESDHLGPIPRTNVSVKISSLSARCDPIDTEGSINDLMRRLGPILEAAGKAGVFVNFDMEQYALKDLTLELFMRCVERYDFAAGLAMQAYLKSGEDDARRICEWAKRTGKQVTVRLVKGAYWDYQVIHAEQMGWPCPVWGTKRETDACFERMTEIFLDNCPREKGQGGVKLALGSHNVRSIAAALAGLEARGLPHSALELQMLHGMADQLKHAAAEMGLRIREYVPVGEMIPGMAYLVRRLLENTSNESWLKAGFLDNADTAALLASPHVAPAPAAANGSVNGAASHGSGAAGQDLYKIAPERHRLSPAPAGVGNNRPFFNEPFRDFSQAAQRRAFAEAIERAVVPRIANDKTPEQAAEMVARAAEAFPAWRDTDPRARAAVLTKAAALMREQRDVLAGVMIKEAGKTWREADADVCEAIDFCEYYARCAVGLFERQRIGRFIGELDEAVYQPRGVAVVISPWNFPLAICTGMTTAALVTGNTVVVKPAEQTPGIASIMCDILWQAGAPKDALHFCPAPGETTGAALVRDPRVALIAFTGSKAVGLDIIRAAGDTRPEQERWWGVKKVVCEMGGKNAIIIDTSADLDEAVLGVRYSAFGFQGQKCSACSRLIVVDPEGEDGPAIRHVTQRLVEATKALVIGDPMRPGTDVGPVIDAESQARILRYIETAKQEGCVLELAMPVPPGLEQGPATTDAQQGSAGQPGGAKHYVGPHIFSHVRPHHTIAQEEIFGPVLAIMHAPTFEEALKLANASPYKLTGGVYSRKPTHIEIAKREFRVGNLYINRGSTGALVARQPFGGFGMSGVGSKAGGPDYLLQFVEPRAICENTLRRGFAPEL